MFPPNIKARAVVTCVVLTTTKSVVHVFLGLFQPIVYHFCPVSLQGSLAYVPQQAWLQSNTLRHNVLFNRKYNEWRYADVIRSCALLPDLDVLEDGDMTEIGDKVGKLYSAMHKPYYTYARYNKAHLV